MLNKMKKKERKTGYYWVKNNQGIWIIAFWWLHIERWDTMKERGFPASHFKEIDERMIKTEHYPSANDDLKDILKAISNG